MKTVREKIIERVIAQIETITVENGYSNNIGEGRVYRQEPVIERGKAPVAAVWELAETRERNRYGGTIRKLIIRVESMVEPKEGKHPAEVSNELLGDLENAMIMGNITLDELIDDIQDISAEIYGYPVNKKFLRDVEIVQLPIDRPLAIAAIEFEIIYTTEWGDPYTRQSLEPGWIKK